MDVDPLRTGIALAVLLAATFVVMSISGLRYRRELAVAAVRAAVQLVAIGYLLRLLLEEVGLPGSLAWVAGMVVVAGSVSAGRGRGLPRVRLVATIAIAIVAGAMAGTTPARSSSTNDRS